MNKIEMVFKKYGMLWESLGTNKHRNIYKNIEWEVYEKIVEKECNEKEAFERIEAEFIEQIFSIFCEARITDTEKFKNMFGLSDLISEFPELMIRSLSFKMTADTKEFRVKDGDRSLEILMGMVMLMKQENFSKKKDSGLMMKIEAIDSSYKITNVFDSKAAVEQFESVVRKKFKLLMKELYKLDISDFKKELFEAMLKDNLRKTEKIKCNVRENEKKITKEPIEGKKEADKVL